VTRRRSTYIRAGRPEPSKAAVILALCYLAFALAWLTCAAIVWMFG
tara:strand:- start:33475 stop:33612 length:138 start_codon:yes stop_codon:yes gene_type:complete